jgi:ubiquitin-protein ligase
MRRRASGRRRVVDEMLALVGNPLPFVEVHIFEWKFYVQPPAGTPDSGKISPLAAIFGDGYPAEPPLLCFTVILYTTSRLRGRDRLDRRRTCR